MRIDIKKLSAALFLNTCFILFRITGLCPQGVPVCMDRR